MNSKSQGPTPQGWSAAHAWRYVRAAARKKKRCREPLILMRRERPWLILVPEIHVASGYSDNIFIAPDVLGDSR